LNNETKEVRTSTSVIKLGNDNIFRVTFIKNSVITPEKLVEHNNAYAHLTQGKPYPFIFDAEENVEFTSGARKFAFKMGCDNMTAIAVVVPNFIYRLAAEYYYTSNKPPVPYKVFTRMDEAENWVRLYS
jgi:hypothetical protein